MERRRGGGAKTGEESLGDEERSEADIFGSCGFRSDEWITGEALENLRRAVRSLSM